MSEKRIYKLLIADADLEFLDSIKADPLAKENPPILTSSGKEAQLALANEQNVFSGIFVNPTVSRPAGISVIRFARLYRPATPVYLLIDQENPFSPAELKHLRIEEVLKKPMKFENFSNKVTHRVRSFDSKSALEVSTKLKQDDKATVNLDDPDGYISIRADDFLPGTISFFDVFVRLESGRFLKLLEAGDSFSVERLNGYLSKNVKYFYIRKEMQQHYLAYCDSLATAILQNVNPGMTNIAVSQTMNHGEETMKFLELRGLDSANLQYAADFLANVYTLVDKLELNQNPVINQFMKDLASYEHGVGVTVIASVLARGMNLTSANPIETVGMASLLHDIGLKALNLSIPYEDEYGLTDAQIKVFHTHPSVGADILKGVKGLKPIVSQAVLQHHERRNKKGYPSRIGAGSLSMVGELIGLSDEYFNLILKAKDNPKIDINKEMKANITGLFSPQLVSEFSKIFLR